MHVRERESREAERREVEVEVEKAEKPTPPLQFFFSLSATPSDTLHHTPGGTRRTPTRTRPSFLP
jgi:hypothetical protein